MGMKSTVFLLVLILFVALYADKYCEEELIYGTYTDYCDCGSSKSVILKKNKEIELINSSELTVCTTTASWAKKGDVIQTIEHPYLGTVRFYYANKYPTKEKWDVITSNSTDYYEKRHQNNKSFEQVLIFKKDKDSSYYSKDIVFYKKYFLKDFESLKCKKNKNIFLKRIIYSEELFESGEKNVLKFLSKIKMSDINLNEKDNDGVTALHAAVDCGFIKIVEFLLKRGVNPNVKNAQGHTPLFLAKRSGAKEIEALLKKYGAK